MDGDPAPSPRPRRARRALLVAGALVLFAVAVGAGVALDRGGKGGKGGNGGGGNGAVAGAASTVAAGDTGNGSGAASGAGGQAGSGGGSTGGGGSASPTTSQATSTTTGGTTAPPLRVVGYIATIDPRCTAAPAGGYYDYTVRITVELHVTGAGTLRFQWGRGTSDVRIPATTYEIPPERQVTPYATYVLRDSFSGRTISAPTKVVDHLHILDPPADRVSGGKVDVLLSHSTC
jgi:hypothetical protein